MSTENDGGPRVRRYIVLQLDRSDLWREFDEPVEAPNATQACRRAAATLDERTLEAGVTLRAVPERSWEAGKVSLRLERTAQLRPT
jgi:hypothetical protein